MSRASILMIAVCLAALMVPLAYAINFIGAINYVATYGGNVTFAQNFQAYSLTYPDGLNRFTQFVWGGTNMGNLGFDADAGVNMTVIGMTRSVITYTVETAALGNVSTYLYYYRLITPHFSAPTLVTGGTYTYDAATHIVNVTTTGSPITVVVRYGGSGPTQSIAETINILFTILPLVALVGALELKKLDLINNKVLALAFLAAAIAIILIMYRAFGY